MHGATMFSSFDCLAVHILSDVYVIVITQALVPISSMWHEGLGNN